jgi:2-hydroxy-4-carboxymuconate semialdehyde hemiacetal dehydrogenase
MILANANICSGVETCAPLAHDDVARYDDLVDGTETPIDVSKVDVSLDGIELQDREFLTAIAEGREPNASVAQVLPAMQTLDLLENCLG